MNMPSTSWQTLRDVALLRLTATAPAAADLHDDPCMRAVVAAMAMSQAQLAADTVANRIGAAFRITPAPDADPYAADLASRLHASIDTVLRCHPGVETCSVSDWVNTHDLITLTTRLVRRGEAHANIRSLAQLAADAAHDVDRRVEDLSARHRQAIIDRDLPSFRQIKFGIGPVVVWALAHETAGKPERPVILQRRRQALELFGSVYTVLMRPAVTAVIDRGDPLVPELSRQLGVSSSHLATLRGAIPPAQIPTTIKDLTPAIVELKAHDIPLHQWPGYRQEPAEAWRASHWLHATERMLLPAPYYGNKTEVADAIQGLTLDLLGPIARERATRIGQAGDQYAIRSFVQELRISGALLDSPERRQFLTGIRNAVIGLRGPKAFGEAVDRWHRRVASLAALRHEHESDRPGWPALCQRWRSADGNHDILPLTTAVQLVDEGNALGHCVGGYYEACRSGSTHIFSMRHHDRCVATIEILVTAAASQQLTLQPGQFKSYGNGRPEPEHHEALREFLGDIRSGQHPVDRGSLLAYLKDRREHPDYTRYGTKLTIAHAREAYPLYRALLPRRSPEGFDEWREASGLDATFDAMLARLTKPATRAERDFVPL